MHQAQSTSHPAQTVVGYQELATEASGNVMIAPTFLKVSESNTVTLADIKVTGYNAPWWDTSGKRPTNKDGCTGSKFALSILTTQGTTEKTYYWLDYMTGAETRVGPGWFASPTAEPIEGGEGSVELDAGKSLWIQGSALSLQPTGAVNPFDIEFKTADSGNVAVGNCTPVDLKLSDLTVTGYKAPWWDTSGKRPTNKDGITGLKFIIQTLTTSGLKDEQYVWLDYMTSATTKVGPGWFADSAGTPIEGGEGSVKLDAGKALWIQGSGYSLQPTGAVNPFDVVYKTTTSGNVAIGNCMPIGTKLSDLTVSGYTAPWWDTSGKRPTNKDGITGLKFIIQTLTTSGLKDEQYVWLDYMTSATTKVGPGWFADSAGTPIEGGADKVVLDPGKGLWVQGSGYNLIVPAPEL